MRRKQHSRQFKRKKGTRPYSTPEPIKGLPRHLRILKAVKLYKDPLEILIYRKPPPE